MKRLTLQEVIAELQKFADGSVTQAVTAERFDSLHGIVRVSIDDETGSVLLEIDEEQGGGW